MKRVLAVAAVLVFAAAGSVVAGDYHTGTSLNCSECHVMHGSQTHGYNANGGGITTPIGGSAPYEYLLRNEVNELCLTCHNNSASAPDVLEANGGTVPTRGRLAGALNMNNASPYFNADGHTLGSLSAAPGGTFSNADGLECVDCHQPHGYGGSTANPYRNLSPFSGGGFHASVSYAVSVNNLSMDALERSATGNNHYDIGNVDFNEPSQTASAYGQWCKTCHTSFHGSSSDDNMRNQLGPAGEEWLRHPTADADIGAVGDGHSDLALFKNKLYRPKVMSNHDDWGTQGVAWAAAPADLTPSCFTCHKAHGNKNSFGLIYPTGANPIGEEGDGAAYRDLCVSCHVQGI